METNYKFSVMYALGIEQHKDEEEEEEDGGNVLHPGVRCDGCSGPVYGTRYKCTVCPDYDLCERCRSVGKHIEHPKIAIKRPQGIYSTGIYSR